MTSTEQTIDLLAGILVLYPHRQRELGQLTAWELITVLDLFGMYLPDNMKHTVFKHILSDTSDIRWKFSVILLRALGKMVMSHQKLEDLSLSNIIPNMEKLSECDVHDIMFACILLSLYDLELFNAVADRALRKDITLKQKLFVCSVFQIFSFMRKDFMSYLVQDVEESLDELNNDEKTAFLHWMAKASHEMPELKEARLTSLLQSHLEQYHLERADMKEEICEL